MRKLLVALVAGVVVTVPAVIGLFGNASFAQRLPLRSPASSSSPSETDSPEPGDDHGGDRPAGVSDDAPGDDHGGDRPAGVSDDAPGDDHGGDRARSSEDNSGRGSDSSGSDDSNTTNSSRSSGLGQLGRAARARAAPARTTRADTRTTTRGTTQVATDPTTDPATPEESPSAPAAVGDVSVLADELLGPAEPAVSEAGLGADTSDPESGATTPRWVTLGEPGGPQHREPLLSPRRVLVLLAVGVVGALLFVGVVGTLAARQLAEREAVNDAATMADILAEAVVQPALTEGLFTGDPVSIAAFDEVVHDQLLSPGKIVRVKVWSADGLVLYADESQLIGRTFPLGEEQKSALDRKETVADVSHLDSSENAFEDGERALEVYRPVWTPDKQTALFELYASYDPVGERTTQLWRGFAGVTASSLLLLVVIVAPLVWALVKRLRRAEEQHIELLQRAVDASADERRRIAASLHDGPVQELAATSFTVAGASATASVHGQTALARDLDAAAAAVRSSIRSLRTLLVDIYPASLARSGIVAALLDLAQTTRRDDLVVRVDATDEDDLAMSTDAQRLVHRVAQECLRNAAKHAGPATVIVSLHRDGPASVTLDVVDDGAGFDVAEVLGAAQGGHLGLHLLADAASVPGALLQVSTAPGRGTHWRLVLDGELGAVS